MEELPIKWMPDVCSCVIFQSRYEPDLYFRFESKCAAHSDLSDADARAAIIYLCSLNSEE